MWLLSLLPFLLWAYTAPEPTHPSTLLDELLDKHADAMGGRAKWEAVKTLVLRLDTGDGGVMEAYTQKPDKFKLVMRFAGHEWIKGWDGQEGWTRYNGELKPMNAGAIFAIT